MIRIVKKSFFTLLELLVVLFILSLGVILTGVKVKEIYQEQRFLSESQQVLSHLAMAQDLMLIMDADVLMKLLKDPESKKLTFWLEIEKPLEEPWDRFIERKVQLTAIQSYEFEGKHEEELTLQFSLGHMSQGILTLCEGSKNDPQLENKRQFQIELPGYPCSLTIKTPKTKEYKKTEKSELLYPIEVYEELYADSKESHSLS